MKAIVLGTGALLVVIGVGMFRQHLERVQLRATIALAEIELQELTALRAQRERLLASKLPESKLRQLRADRAALNRLRTELENLKDTVAAKRAPVAHSSAVSGDVLPPPTVTEGPVSENFLRNIGRATPAAAVETALWAATGGDVETLVDGLLLEGDARERASQILAALPYSARGQYRTPEHLIALLTAREIPLAGIQIMPPKKDDPAGTRVLARMPGADGKSRTVAVTLRQCGSEWKMVVPLSAVEKFERMLGGQDAAPLSK